jgi:hypothetical protein
MANRIHAKGPFVQEEYVTGAAGIKPGMLVKVNSSNEVVVHANAEGVLGDEVMIVTEDALQSGGIAGTYPDGDICTVNIYPPGSTFRGLLSAGESIAIGDSIVSGGDGYLDKAGSPVKVSAKAMETLDISASSAVATLALMRAV